MAATLASALGLESPQTVVIVGSGGKTTLLFALGRELALAGQRVAVSTTTRIHPPKGGQADGLWLLAGQTPDAEEIKARLPKGRLMCLAERQSQDGKLMGLAADQVKALADTPDLWLLLEADGSARKPLKAWAEHEPVVPDNIGLMITVAGARGLGRAISEDMVHRARDFARVALVEPGSPVTPAALAMVLTGQLGPLKALPKGARAVLILNQTDAAQPKLLRGTVEALALACAGLPEGKPCYQKIFTASLRRGRLEEVE